MDDILFVGGGEAVADLRPKVQSLAEWQWCFCQARTERFPLKQFGNNVRRAILRAKIVDGEHIGMIQRTGDPGFLLKAAKAIRVAREGFRQDFQGDFAIQT